MNSNYRMTIGRHSYLVNDVGPGGTTVIANDGGEVNIGNFTSIAGNCTMLLSAEHSVHTVSTYPFDSFPETWPKKIKNQPFGKGDINIGHDVWIGYGVTILSGVTIGNGSIIGAGAVVTKEVPPYSIVAGNPATIKRGRFTMDVVEQLLKIAWWNWSDETIKKYMSYFEGPIEKFIEDFGYPDE